MKRILGYYFAELGAGTDVGSVREQNEDAYHTLLGTGSPDELFDALLIVADGMGGHAAGEVASEMAVTNLPKHLVESLSADDGDKDIESVLSESVKKTNFDIFEKSKEFRNLIKILCKKKHAKIWSGNLLRVLDKNQEIAIQLQNTD